MKKIILLLIFVYFHSDFSAQNLNEKIFDEKAQQEILIGHCDLNGLKSEPFDEWFKPEFENYISDKKILKKIKKEKFNSLYEIKIIMGTWCSDSRREVPRFYTILSKLKFDYKKITLINVDRKKEASSTNVNQLDISRVPTFIVYKSNKEIGRIVEAPKETLEIDLLKIIKTKF
ncbi:MAG: thioredoxin family protein [Bacteroidales bacterium]|nr:thioredoxin family protein [Bacteroidales bacterium]MBN2756180.1 thioredoxin family protein [Bacteroidales bacterium]